jgi:hypothetical protein
MSFETLELALSTWTHLKSILVGVWKEGSLILTSEDLCELKRQFPGVELRCFNGSRFETYRYNLSSSDDGAAIHINHIAINLEVDDSGDGEVNIEPIVFVDNVPIWTNEAPVSLAHLIDSLQGPGGARALCSQWCCECDIDNFNGVLTHVVVDHSGKEYMVWDIHDPGPCRRFIFEKEQYTKAVNNARLAEVQLLYRTQLESVLSRSSFSMEPSSDPQLSPNSVEEDDEDSMDWEEEAIIPFKYPISPVRSQLVDEEEEEALFRRQESMFRNLH